MNYVRTVHAPDLQSRLSKGSIFSSEISHPAHGTGIIMIPNGRGNFRDQHRSYLQAGGMSNRKIDDLFAEEDRYRRNERQFVEQARAERNRRSLYSWFRYSVEWDIDAFQRREPCYVLRDFSDLQQAGRDTYAGAKWSGKEIARYSTQSAAMPRLIRLRAYSILTSTALFLPRLIAWLLHRGVARLKRGSGKDLAKSILESARTFSINGEWEYSKLRTLAPEVRLLKTLDELVRDIRTFRIDVSPYGYLTVMRAIDSLRQWLLRDIQISRANIGVAGNTLAWFKDAPMAVYLGKEKEDAIGRLVELSYDASTKWQYVLSIDPNPLSFTILIWKSEPKPETDDTDEAKGEGDGKPSHLPEATAQWQVRQVLAAFAPIEIRLEEHTREVLIAYRSEPIKSDESGIRT